MALLPEFEIDEHATIEQVRKFFDNDLPKIMLMANKSYVDIKSPVISGMPSQPHEGNSTDDKLSNYAYANSILESFLLACKSMPHPHREFIELRYLKDLSWGDIEIRMNVTTRRGNQIINEAFLQFAWAFSDTEDFRIFK